MHDWILLSIVVEWRKGDVTISFDTYEFGVVALIAQGLVSLSIPKHDSWGESESVNKVIGPAQLNNGNYQVELEIQSGDTIVLEAAQIQMPKT